MNISVQDLIALATIVLPFAISLSQGLYKHIVDSLPSNQRQAVVDTVRIATQAFAADPSIANDAETAAAAILKELHLPNNPNLIKSLVTLFKQDVAQSSTDSEQSSASSEEVPSVGFAAPVHPSAPPHPGL